MKGVMKRTPALVVQDDSQGREVILGLGVPRLKYDGLGRSFNTSISATVSDFISYSNSTLSGESFESDQRELASNSHAVSPRTASLREDMRKMFSKLFSRRNTRRTRRPPEVSDSVIEADISRNASTDIVTILEIFSQHDHGGISRDGVQTLHILTILDDNNKRIIASSLRGMKCLFDLLSVDDTVVQFYAALTLANVANVERNITSFILFRGAVATLLSLLSDSFSPLGQKGAATALASLSFWRLGARLILDSPNSIEKFVALSLPSQSNSPEPDRGQDAAKRTLLNLSRWWDKDSVLDVPNLLTVLAGLLDTNTIDDLRFGSLQMHAKASRAFASLSSTRTSAHRIAHSPEFPLVLTVLVRLLVRTIPTKACPNRKSWPYARNMAALAFANLCVAEDIQVVIVNHPEVLTVLFKSFVTVRESRILDGAYNLGYSQVHEWAAMALGNLALARANRRKIATFGMICNGLDNLGKILYQDTNPTAQDHAAWAFANISEDVQEAPHGPAAAMAAYVNIMGGLVHLLELPKDSVDGLVRTNLEPVVRIQARQEAARAIANLSYANQNHVQLMNFPNMVKSLIGLMTQHAHPGSSAITEKYASRAISHLSATKAFWSSSEIFAQTLPGLILLLSRGAADMCEETRTNAAVIIGNFAQLQAHQWKIMSSKLAMEGLVKLLHGFERPWGSEVAARAISILANGSDYFTKIALALFPGISEGLQKLLRIDGEVNLLSREYAAQALEGLRDFVFVDA